MVVTPFPFHWWDWWVVGPPTNLPHVDDESPSMRRIREAHRLDAFERPSPLASAVADRFSELHNRGGYGFQKAIKDQGLICLLVH